jgi:hypothetical protein
MTRTELVATCESLSANPRHRLRRISNNWLTMKRIVIDHFYEGGGSVLFLEESSLAQSYCLAGALRRLPRFDSAT